MTSKLPKFAVAPGGVAELREAGIVLVDPKSRAPLEESAPDLVADPGTILVGMRSTDPGHEVPGTRGGFKCARCGQGMRLAPSGQRLAEKGIATWCAQCFFMGPAS